MNTKELLIAARARIEKPERWTQMSLARDAKRRSVKPLDADAVCWCSLGAIYSQCPQSKSLSLAIRALGSAMSNNESFIADYNDSHTHAEVLAAFDQAIASLE